MKRSLLILAGVSFLIGFGSRARAQGLTPEFHLDLSVTDTIVNTRDTARYVWKSRDTIRYTFHDGVRDTVRTLVNGDSVPVQDTVFFRDTVTQVVNGDTIPVRDIYLVIRDTVILGGRSVGYDPTATDGYDAKFGEDVFYPGSAFGSDLYFDYPPPGTDQTRIDIRYKPTGPNFKIFYTMHVSCINYPDLLNGSVLWDPAQIPSSITAMTISANEDTATVLVDMKKQNRFIITQAMQKNTSHTYQVTLVYGNASLVAQGVSGASLIAMAEVYPNPMSAAGKLHLSMGDAAHLTITGYDVAGRVCIQTSTQASAGENEIDLSSLSKSHGAIMLHIEATSDGRHETKNVMVMSE